MSATFGFSWVPANRPVVQWFRARFNDVYEKAEWAKARCADELPYVDRLVHDRARDIVSCVPAAWY